MTIDGASFVGSVNERVIALVDRFGGDGVVVEIGGDESLVDALAPLGHEHVRLPVADVAAGSDSVLDRLRTTLAGREVAALVARDTIGWLGDAEQSFRDLAALSAQLGDVPLVLSVPNIAHLDVAVRLVLGRWDVGDVDRFAAAGATSFDHRRLSTATARAGLIELGAEDQIVDVTLSTLEADHPAVSPATTLRAFLDGVRSGADEYGSTCRFVRAYRPGGAVLAPTHTDTDVDAAPFVSVVVRTLGDRSSLDDALTSLAAQTDDDFEVILAVHRAAGADGDRAAGAVRSFVAAFAPAFASRVRIEEVIGGGRSAPLNRAIDVAAGRYLAILDDDDVVAAHWIEQFRRAYLRAPGRVLRTLSVAQPHRQVSDGLIDYEPIGGFETPFARAFDLLEHRHFNQSPPCSFAVPVAGLRGLGIRFDDDLEVCEDWDLLLTATSLLGVSNVESYTSVYRRFDDAWSASGGIAGEVWNDALHEVRARHDRTPTLVPAGGLLPLSHLRDRLNHLLEAYPSVVGRLEAMERSRYWRLTSVLRWVTAQRAR